LGTQVKVVRQFNLIQRTDDPNLTALISALRVTGRLSLVSCSLTIIMTVLRAFSALRGTVNRSLTRGYANPSETVTYRHFLVTLRKQLTVWQLRRTGLYDFHVENGAKMVPFAGYSMPLSYGDIGQGG